MERKIDYLGLIDLELSEFTDYDTAKIVIQSIPFDKTSTWGKGADKGPAAILDASYNLELYDIETDSEVYTEGIFTADPIEEETSEAMIDAGCAQTKKFLDDGKFVITLGGEHSISYAPIKAYAKEFPNMSVLQLDAHTDLRDTYEGSKYNHACVMARVKKFVDNVVSVGIRSMDSSEILSINKAKIFFAHQIKKDPNWIEKTVAQLSDEVYITLDLDVFDPSIMPSTGTPEPGGLDWYEVTNLLKEVIKQKKVVGFDIVELAPTKNKAPDFLAAKLIYVMLSQIFKKD